MGGFINIDFDLSMIFRAYTQETGLLMTNNPDRSCLQFTKGYTSFNGISLTQSSINFVSLNDNISDLTGKTLTNITASFTTSDLKNMNIMDYNWCPCMRTVTINTPTVYT